MELSMNTGMEYEVWNGVWTLEHSVELWNGMWTEG